MQTVGYSRRWFAAPLSAHTTRWIAVTARMATAPNRLFLRLMVVRAMREVLGREVASTLVYDAPHYLIWEPDGAEPR
ncbi:hypothetical protein [Sorangium sp. So ce693]|uniref:hypothetical protein n=1 Tax=Sorangium sp. So ce693 TaxID=3133318 RepID=UPI003F61FF61